MLILSVSRLRNLLVPHEVERAHLQVLSPQLVAGHFELFALLDIVHGAEDLVVLELDPLVLGLGVGVLVLSTLCCHQRLFLRLPPIQRL